MACLVAALLAIFASCRGPHEAGATNQIFRAGAAEVDITPPPGNRMAGYFDERIATGVHDPLKAKALVLQQGHTQVALVFCDLIGLSLHVSTNARALASRQTGIPVGNIVLSATHTHTGPLFDDVRQFYFHQAAVEKFGTDPHQTLDYPTFLTHRLVQAIATAQAHLQQAELVAGDGRCEGLAFNRRYWMKSGKVVFNPGQLNPNIVRPAGPTDPEVGLLELRVPGAPQPFAGATIFAMHSDSVGGTLYSADYEYYLEQTLRGVFGSNYISAFGLGTCGDINHINVQKREKVSGFDVAESLGGRLGQAVLEAQSTLHPVHAPELAVRSRVLTVSLQRVSTAQLANAQALVDKLGDPHVDFYERVAAVKILDLAQRGVIWPMEVQVLRLNSETALVCLPGEIFVELGLAIKQHSPFKHTLVMSVCNDRPSYIPTRKAFAEGSYEVSNSRVQPDAGEQLVQTALQLLRELKKD